MRTLVKDGPHEILQESRDGEEFAMFDPRGNLMCWCFLRYSDMRYYFMGEIPEGQGDIERLHGKKLRGRKAY